MLDMDGDFRLGEWLVRPSLGRAERDGRVVPLRAKVADLLVFFARHPGTVLPKARVLLAVWGTRFVTESALTRTITELRRAFDDDAAHPWLIETIAKRGYRLLPPVTWQPGTHTPAGPDPTAGTQPAAILLVWGDTRLSVGEGTHLIGRDRSAAVRLDSAAVSRRHASLVVTAALTTITDLGSRNGTFVNGIRIEAPVPVICGDEIRVGPARIVLEGDDRVTTSMTGDERD